MKNKIRPYVIGSLIGMIGEYLYRVEFSVIPFIILIILCVGVYVDVNYDN